MPARTREAPPAVRAAEQSALAALQRAYELGATVIDIGSTGSSRRLAARFLADLPRRRVVVSATVAATGADRAAEPWSPALLRRRLRSVLRDLAIDHLDLMALRCADIAAAGPLRIATELNALRGQGLFDALALDLSGPPSCLPWRTGPTSSSDPSAVRAAIEALEPAVLVADLSALTAPAPTGLDPFALAANHGLAVLVTDPLAHDLLLGPGARTPRPARATDATETAPLGSTREQVKAIDGHLLAIGTRFGSTTADLTRAFLRMLLHRHCRTVVLCELAEHRMEEYFGGLGAAFTSDDADFLGRWGERLRRRLVALDPAPQPTEEEDCR
ncbi:hypothetical protein BIV57_10760 [Mangrovactinospora gilvigrisea]|uniref:NADP-dependent oxidoreductase domain-containing protein n=1 Tax=Mangrovactinospora gilvigrisea TaxID=1428644 RepID=A0A1J7BVD3_9ACTN|nr:aldo/keto reductase [Mangrovactinospora gilvigrisea]OIV37441.1 hypothetical protein BIV57_10760 [Mangrovactinospora gilvigrisea]